MNKTKKSSLAQTPCASKKEQRKAPGAKGQWSPNFHNNSAAINAALPYYGLVKDE